MSFPQSNRRSKRRGSAVAMLIVGLSLSAFGVGLLLPALNKNTETANRVKCENNLKQIGLCIMLYANDNRGDYPRTVYHGASTVIPDVTNAGFDSADPFKQPTAFPPNCVPSAIFLLLRTEDITSAVFVCPSTSASPDIFANQTAINRCNFTDLTQNLSYSYANPYPDSAARAAGYRLRSALDAAFVIFADKNPGTANGANVLAVSPSSTRAQLRIANSHNHNQAGQNMLFADGHVEFNSTVFTGINQDNIYCRGMGGPGAADTDIVNSPQDKNDSVLLPAETN